MIKQRVFFSACLCLLLTGMRAGAQSTDALPRSNPEKEGVSSAGLLSFVEAAEKSKNEFHSFMALRHGKVIAEGWWNPYRPELKQALYSVSKSFTSTAIGFAVSEGRLSVNDKVASFFPNDLPAKLYPSLNTLTVKDLLCMLEGQDPDPTGKIANADSNWVRGFLRTPIVNKPGTHFLYNTMGVHVLAAIVESRTGEHLIDYLKPRLFDPLGIKDADWEVSPLGVATGGWGLRLRTEDLAKVGELYLQQGSWNGRQLLPKQWVADATTSYNDEGPSWAVNAPRDSSDWKQGYGYLFWRCRHNAYRADGAYGQLIVVMPEEDAVLAVTCETSDMQDEMNLIWKYFLPAMHEGALPPDRKSGIALQRKLASLALPLPSGTAGASMGAVGASVETRVNGKVFSVLPNTAGLRSVKFGFSGSACHVGLQIDSVGYSLVFGSGKWIKAETTLPSPNLMGPAVKRLSPFQVAGSYAWKGADTLELQLRYVESPHTETILCHFDQNKLSMTVTKSFDFGKKELVLEGASMDMGK